jgi:hypothetical protein
MKIRNLDNKKADQWAATRSALTTTDNCIMKTERNSPKSEPTRKKRRNYRKLKTQSTSRTARAATLSIKCKSSTIQNVYVSIDLDTFKQTFFNTKHLPEYSRLPPHLKLLSAQFIIHNQQAHTNPTPFPFTYRYSFEQRKLSDKALNKKIQRKLSTALNRKTVLFWSTSEHETGRDKTLTHRHGEILLFPNELPICRQAFKELFGLYETDPITKQPVLNANGMKKAKPGLSHAIRFSMASRQQQAAHYGWLYAIYNWPGYSTKDNETRERQQKLNMMHKISATEDKGNYCYISSNLKTLAEKLYGTSIRKY